MVIGGGRERMLTPGGTLLCCGAALDGAGLGDGRRNGTSGCSGNGGSCDSSSDWEFTTLNLESPSLCFPHK